MYIYHLITVQCTLWPEGCIGFFLYITLPHYHYADVSEDIGHAKSCQVYAVECVIKINSIFSILQQAIHVAVCIQVTHFAIDACEIECIFFYLIIIIIIKSEVWNMCHCLWLGHETMVCAVCLSMFLHTWFQGYLSLVEWYRTYSYQTIRHD